MRGHEVESYGIVLRMMMRVIEEVFDVGDEYFHDFILCEDKEDLEHQLILLMKRMLDFVERGLQNLLIQTIHLDSPIDKHINKEFEIIQQTLIKYPYIILSEEKNHIETLKHEVEKVHSKTLQKRKNLKQIR